MSSQKLYKITVLGTGAFGTAMAYAASLNQSNLVKFWTKDPEPAWSINYKHINSEVFKDTKLADSITATTNLDEALNTADVILSALPVQVMPDFLQKIKGQVPSNVPFVCCSKGMVVSKEKFISEIVHEIFDNRLRYCIFSGPTFAREIIQKNPSSAVIASHDKEARELVQRLLSSQYLRLYTQEDVAGVEIAGALKNVLAIGAGVLEGLGYGLNTRAAFLARGGKEVQEFSKLYGANPKTFYGLAGMGDLILTCLGQDSRNHKFGVRVGQGMSIEQALKESAGVVEGYPTLGVVLKYARRKGLEMPLFTVLEKYLHGEVGKEEALKEIMTKKLESEWMDF